MEKSQEIGKLAKALCGFQADMENVGKDATNPFFKSKYATLENIITTAKPHLKKHGLAFAQFPSQVPLRGAEGGVTSGLTTILMHDSGEWIESATPLNMKDQTPQAQGSAITYMRRYALSGVLGIATEDDDDGNEASTPRQPAKSAPQRTPVAPTKKETTQRQEADKDRLKSLLAMHGHKGELTVKQVKDAVFDITGEQLTSENVATINETLSAKLEAKEAQE